jgi:hypothetical protein
MSTRGSHDVNSNIWHLQAAGVEPTSQHPYWAANGGVTYQDPDGREVVFVPWVYGRDRT